MGENSASAISAYRAVNVEGTRGVVQAMIAAGVRRIVYLSSIKACGERSLSSHPLSPEDPSAPEDPYGVSKFEAEQLLMDFGRRGLIEPVIIRPVLIHGAGAKGNLMKLMEAIRTGRLLPFGGIHNRRSLVGLDNLCDAIITAATLPWERFGNPGTPVSVPASVNSGGLEPLRRVAFPVVENLGTPASVPAFVHATPESGVPGGDPDTPVSRVPGYRIYHLADDGVISTRRLVEVLAEGMGVKPRLIPVPRWAAMAGATMLGKRAMVRRLFDDLEVDASAFARDTGWRPKKSLDDGLREMAADYAQRHDDKGHPGIDPVGAMTI